MKAKNVKIKHRLALLFAVFAFTAFGVLAFDTLNVLKINGPYYRQIVLGKDLVADILPPPEYILEEYLIVHQMADPANRPFLASLTAKSESLRRDYDERHKFWAKNLPESTDSEKRIKEAMIDDSYQPAIRFLNTIHATFLPAVQRGDYQTAALLLHGPLQEDYEAHRTAIDQVVTLTNTSNGIIEANAARIIAARLAMLAVLGIAIVVGTALSLSRFLQRAIAEGLAEKADTFIRPAPDEGGHEQSGSSRSLSNKGGDLADHASTLALGAALEAARNSGSALSLLESQDRGFGLVAAEFRHLADENAKLSQQIHYLVGHLQTTSATASSAVSRETP